MVNDDDRVVAADIWRDFIAKTGEVIVENCLRRGDMDDSLLVERISSHRAQATAELVGVLREVVDALDMQNPVESWKSLAISIRTARALLRKHGGE